MAESDQTFEYTNLKSPSAIRLLRLEPAGPTDLIRCVLDEYELSASPPFVAVSYCWGFASFTAEIHVNDRLSMITANLDAVLRQLREDARPDEKYIWVDALCINQAHTSEKDVQIKLMPQIYARATKVISWISRADVDAKLLYPVRRFVDNGFRLPEVKERAKAAYYAISRSLIALCQSNYWRRIWIVQEVSLAREVEVVCNVERVNWRDLFDTLDHVIGDGDAPTWDVKRNLSQFIAAGAVRLRQLDRLRVRIQSHEHIPLLQTLFWTRDCEATHTKDKIFALLGLVTDSWLPSQSLYYGDSLEMVEKKITLGEMAEMSPSGAILGRPYRLDVITFTNPALQKAGARRWSPSWTDRSMWLSLRKWQHLRLDWSPPPFDAAPSLLEMPGQSGVEALNVRGYSLGSVCRHNEKAPWLYRERGALLRAARGLLEEMDSYPRKALLDWPIAGRDGFEPASLTTDLTRHRKRLHDLIGYVERCRALGEDQEGGGSDVINEPGICHRYKEELRNFLLLGSSTAEESSMWTFERMRFVHTTQGYIGFGLFLTQPGDIVYLVQGCSTPIILRRYGSGLTARGFIVVGEMLVLGLMHGQYFHPPENSMLLHGSTDQVEEDIEIL